jgi:hypothetical protein
MRSSVRQLFLNMEWLFPEYDFQTIDVESHKWVIIERILERGSWDQARWLIIPVGNK